VFELAASLGVYPDALVVDVGCGRGTRCVELTDRFGCRSIGVDVVFPPLRYNDRVQLIQGSIEQLPIRDESVDFVWCRDMLVHVSDQTRALTECARILGPNGKMLLYTT
jgi:ubiquinone/menaquinone biosynthesis C-methylase UbiE